MADFNTIKQAIDAYINSNGNKEITGKVLNSVLKNMVDATESAIIKAVQEILGDAPLDYDTLKEIAEYIATDKEQYARVLNSLAEKVDKVDGKGLSENDFTDAEKAKLANLKNYDDSGVKAEIQKKQDKITDLDAIRSGAAKGETALQSVPDEYAKKSDLNNKVDKEAGKGLSTYDFNSHWLNKIDSGDNEPLWVGWEELRDLRDNGELIAGRLYRIIDYTATTTQENTRSAGHRFDLIVLALSENTLSEEAYAIYSDEDSYFADNGANLSAWKIWYCLDNDRERFAWADEENGRGVIYRMIDEWGNDCPYDFKNIQFMRGIYASGGGIAKEDGDEDFFVFCYTFSWEDDEKVIMDASLVGNNGNLLNDEGQIVGVYGNIIGKYISFDDYLENPALTKQWLNDIVFLSTYEYESRVFYGCYNNIFGNECYNNSFGNECYDNIFGNRCYNNIFGNRCSTNSFGSGCGTNSFGNGCNTNSFGNNCFNNSLGNVCFNNSLGNGCTSNSLGNNCSRNSFGNGCSIVELNEGTIHRTASVNSSGVVKVFNLADLADL